LVLRQSALGLAVILWFVIIKSQNYFLLWARKQQQEPWSLDNYGVASPLHAIPAPMAKSCAMLIRIPKSEFLLEFNTTTVRSLFSHKVTLKRLLEGFLIELQLKVLGTIHKGRLLKGVGR
jgi:hypothetical protein